MKFVNFVFIVSLLSIPAFLTGVNIQTAKDNAKKGEFLFEVWLPPDAEVFVPSQFEEWKEKVGERWPFYTSSYFDTYKEQFSIPDAHTKHYVMLGWLGNQVAYRTHQGKATVGTETLIDGYPDYVSFESMKHLGNGEVLLSVKPSRIGYIGAVLCGLFKGGLIDMPIALAWFFTVVVVGSRREWYSIGRQ